MSRFLRIVIFTLLITAIVFFGFRASQPIQPMETKANSVDQQTIQTTKAAEVKALSEKITPPDLQDLSAHEASVDLDQTDQSDEIKNNQK